MPNTTATIITTIVTTVMGGIVGYYSARRISTLNTKNIECSMLRKAFAPTLAKIYLTKKHGSTHEVPNLDSFFKDELLCHASAIEAFRPFVGKADRTAYQEAWEKYRYEVWDYGFDANTMNHDIENPYATYKNLIEKILRFAEIRN